jgi:hypothetical protein
MGEEIELAAKTTGEVVAALAEESGVLGPLRERFAVLTARVHYRNYPKLIWLARQAAHEIEASGLPREAFEAIPDPLLRSILEAGAIEENEELQARWASLLANVLTANGTAVPRSFPRILSELEPPEVVLLAALAEIATSEKDFLRLPVLRQAIGKHYGKHYGLNEANLDNIERLGLIRYEAGGVTRDPMEDIARASRSGYCLTPLGLAFVEACRAPKRLGRS